MYKLIFIIFFSISNLYAQDNNFKKTHKNDPATYLIENIFFESKDTGSIIILPLETERIKHYLAGNEIQYWDILKKYYPKTEKSKLIRIINKSEWINENIILDKKKIFFPKINVNQSTDFYSLSKMYYYSPIYIISKPIYSETKDVCIFYVNVFQGETYTIEIQKNNSGEWKSHIITLDWIE